MVDEDVVEEMRKKDEKDSEITVLKAIKIRLFHS